MSKVSRIFTYNKFKKHNKMKNQKQNKQTNINYDDVAKMTIHFLLKKDDSEPEMDAIYLLRDHSHSQTGFKEVVDYFAGIHGEDSIDLAIVIAEQFYQTDALDTCYMGFERWLEEEIYQNS